MNLTTSAATQNLLIVSNGLVSYWSMNDGAGSVSLDYSAGNPQTNQLNIVGTPVWVPTIVGPGLSFDGSTQYCKYPITHSCPIGGTARSVACWVKMTVSATNYGVIIEYGDQGVTATRLGWYIGVTSPYVGVAGSSIVDITGVATWSTAAGITSGVWTHIAMTCNGTTGNGNILFYKNGVSLATSTNAVPTALITKYGPSHWLNASGGTSATPAAVNNACLMDDFRVYNRVITPAEVNLLYLARGA